MCCSSYCHSFNFTESFKTKIHEQEIISGSEWHLYLDMQILVNLGWKFREQDVNDEVQAWDNDMNVEVAHLSAKKLQHKAEAKDKI